MPIFEFKCPDCGNIDEKLVKYDVVAITCDCGGLMKKQMAMPTIMLDGTDPSLPGAYDKWGRDREKRAAQNRKKSYFEP